MDVLHELRKVAGAYPRKAEPILLALSGVGPIGHLSGAHGIYVNSAVRRQVRSLFRDHYRAEALARRETNGRFGASDLLPLARAGSDSTDAIRAIKRMSMAITSWDGVVNARSGSQYWDFVGTKASQTTVANQWSSFLKTAGVPGAMTYGAKPGPAAISSSTTGAWPISNISLGASDDLYLTNIGGNHATGTNIVMAIDVLQAVGDISLSGAANATQSISTTALNRYSGGAGVMMTLEITVALGGTAANITLSYTDQGGTAAGTGAIALLTSGIVGRLTPVQDGALIRLAAGDYGVRSVENVYCSASMGTGNASVIMYKPLIIFPTLATTTFVERSTPAQIGGIKRITTTTQGVMPALGFFVNTSTTSTGVQTYLTEFVWG
jgi:hypothetical protein